MRERAAGLADNLVSAKEWLEVTRAEHIRFIDTERTWVDRRAAIGRGTIIFPGCCIMGTSSIGERCVIFPNVTLLNVIAEEDVIIGVPILKNSHLGTESVVGATAEMNRVMLGKKTKMLHHGYLGDATVGDESNIGAGAVTANWNGARKHRTQLGKRAFVGVNANILAPNNFLEDIEIAAGSTISANLAEARSIPPGSLVISRVKKVTIKPRKT